METPKDPQGDVMFADWVEFEHKRTHDAHMRYAHTVQQAHLALIRDLHK